jgi:iron(III) transport system permease protein
LKRQEFHKPLTQKKLKNQIMNVVGNPYNMVVLCTLIILVVLIVIPLMQMVKTTFTLAASELRRVDGKVGDFTLYYWKYLFASNLSLAVLWEPLLHSLFL